MLFFVLFCFFVLFFFFFFHVCVLSLIICLFIISGGFDFSHQLSVKKDPLEIQHPKLENSRCGPFMRDNGRCDILHSRLAPSWALLCSQISVEPYIPKGPANVKITTLYRLGPPHGHNDKK